MKITQDRLRQIIKEELEEVLSEKNKNTDDDEYDEYEEAMKDMPKKDYPSDKKTAEYYEDYLKRTK